VPLVPFLRRVHRAVLAVPLVLILLLGLLIALHVGLERPVYSLSALVSVQRVTKVPGRQLTTVALAVLLVLTL